MVPPRHREVAFVVAKAASNGRQASPQWHACGTPAEAPKLPATANRPEQGVFESGRRESNSRSQLGKLTGGRFRQACNSQSGRSTVISIVLRLPPMTAMGHSLWPVRGPKRTSGLSTPPGWHHGLTSGGVLPQWRVRDVAPRIWPTPNRSLEDEAGRRAHKDEPFGQPPVAAASRDVTTHQDGNPQEGCQGGHDPDQKGPQGIAALHVAQAIPRPRPTRYRSSCVAPEHAALAVDAVPRRTLARDVGLSAMRSGGRDRNDRLVFEAAWMVAGAIEAGTVRAV